MSKITLPQYQEQPISPFINGQLPFYIGMHASQSSTGFKPHYHSFAEFTFVISGTGYKTVNGQSHDMKPGATCLYLPHHVHESQRDPNDPPIVYCCMFDMQLLTNSSLEEQCLDMIYQVGSAYPSYVYLEGEFYDRMKMLLHELYTEYSHPAGALGRETMIRCKLTEAILLFLKNLGTSTEKNGHNTLPERDSIFWSILQFIHIHYKEAITRETVAQHFHMSSPHISRLFKEHTGQNFLQYVHQLRIRAATHLLTTTDMSVSQITFAVGFESFRTFARVFRELQGQTPSDYRNLQREKVSGI